MEIEHDVDEEGEIIKIDNIKISLCMIVKHDAAEWMYIENCLSNAYGEVSEIIVVTDKSAETSTKVHEIAKKFKVNVMSKDWTDDFSELRNFSIKHATGEWILVLDADEIITKADFTTVKKTLETNKKLNAYEAFELPQVTYNNNTWDYKWQSVDNFFTQNSVFKGAIVVPIIRLFRNNGQKFISKVHEVLDEKKLKGKIGRISVAIHHLKYMKGIENVNESELRYLELLKKESEENPKNVKALFDIGLTYRNILKDNKKALEYLEKALEQEQATEILMSIGATYSDLGNLEKAIEFYNKALKKDQENSIAYTNLGFIYYRLENYKQALHNLEKALQLQAPNKDFIKKLILDIEEKL